MDNITVIHLFYEIPHVSFALSVLSAMPLYGPPYHISNTKELQALGTRKPEYVVSGGIYNNTCSPQVHGVLHRML